MIRLSESTLENNRDWVESMQIELMMMVVMVVKRKVVTGCDTVTQQLVSWRNVKGRMSGGAKHKKILFK